MITDLSQLPPVLGDLLAAFPAEVLDLSSPCVGQWFLKASKTDAHRIAEHVADLQDTVFVSRFGLDERHQGGGFGLVTVFNLGHDQLYLAIVSEFGDEHVGFPSLVLKVPAANWAEREVRDQFGLIPVGHPDPRRLVLYEDWPDDLHPMRKDFDPRQAVARKEAPFDQMRIAGEGVFEVPVGPIHAGVIEPGHFRFSVDGEHIINLEARLFWTHRGLEKQAEGRSLEDGLLIAERVCGACSFANALAYAQAVEALAACKVPARAEFIRVVAAELERIYNHLGDMGGVLTDVAYSVGSAQLMRHREVILQLNERIAGNRLLRGLIALGGVRRDLSPDLADRIRQELTAIHQDILRTMDIALTDETVLDRLETTGRLDPQVAQDLGVVGPAARAAGIDRDVRRDHPYAAYPALTLTVPRQTNGDVLARVKLKQAEISASVSLIRQALDKLPEGPVRAPLGSVRSGVMAFGITESARGENLHAVMIGSDGLIERYAVRSSSYMIWPSLQLAVLGNIVPDFPVINKSFNLCYACTDR